MPKKKIVVMGTPAFRNYLSSIQAEVDMLIVIRRLVVARLSVIACTGNLNGVGFTFTVYSSIGKLSTSATMF